MGTCGFSGMQKNYRKKQHNVGPLHALRTSSVYLEILHDRQIALLIPEGNLKITAAIKKVVCASKSIQSNKNKHEHVQFKKKNPKHNTGYGVSKALYTQSAE